MIKDWRWKLAILMFSIAPAYGIGKYIEYYQIQNSETEVAVSDFESKISESLAQFQINEFETEDVQIVESGKYEYAVVTSVDSESPTDAPAAVLLRQRKWDAHAPLNDQVASGVVSGLVSSRQKFNSESLAEMGLPISASAGRVYFVDVNRDYLPGIAKLTTVFVFIGLGVLFVVYTKLEDRYLAMQNRRSYVNGQVALQLSIARQETYHR